MKKNSEPEYEDQIYDYLIKLKPGTRINVMSAADPKRFIRAVKNLMDNWGLRGKFSFNADYTVLRRINDINFEFCEK